MRTYEDNIKNQYLGIDIDGDLLVDFYDASPPRVDDDSISDYTAPMKAPNFQAVVAEDFSSVNLTWERPADPDFNVFHLIRTIERDGKESVDSMFERSAQLEYLDTDVQEGDIIHYDLHSLDARNTSDPAVVESPF